MASQKTRKLNGKAGDAAPAKEERRPAKFPVVTGEQLELLLAVNRRTVQRYVKERGLPKMARDRYDLREVWRWQMEQLTVEMAGQNVNADRLLKAQADEREHKAAILAAKRATIEGRMVDRAVMEADLLDRALAVKKQMELMKENLGERLIQILACLEPGKKGQRKNEGEIAVLVREAVEQAAADCMNGFAREPGEFDRVEELAAGRLAEQLAAKISDPEKREAGQAAILRVLREQWPALVTAMVKAK